MHFHKMFNYLQFSTKYKINTAPFGRKEIMGDNTDDGCCYIFTKYRQRIRTLGSKGDNTDDGAAATIIPNIDTEYITLIMWYCQISWK